MGGALVGSGAFPRAERSEPGWPRAERSGALARNYEGSPIIDFLAFKDFLGFSSSFMAFLGFPRMPIRLLS